MTPMPDITGQPRWAPARESVARLRESYPHQAEANVQSELAFILRSLFPALPSSELAIEKQSGDGPIDLYCRNAVFETKRQGKLDARLKPDGSTETPEDQAVRYLNALTAQPDMFTLQGIGWRACITDGQEWYFYDYRRNAPEGHQLTPTRRLNLIMPDDDDALLVYLYDFITRTAKFAPPVDDRVWAEKLARPFLELADEVARSASPAYGVKLALWRDLLQGAYITPPEAGSDGERDLFARHTMLVVTARAITDTILPDIQTAPNRSHRYAALANGFAAWLLDAAGNAGPKALDGITQEMSLYDWQHNSRDALKDLYHAIIPRSIRHDFGEYYTPDWLARAVCEEVMDPQWRQEIISMALAGHFRGPAVLDPSCGSGTFLYHATQLLLEDARQRPELADSPQAIVEIVNALVAGIDLHPVAVELSKTTKLLSFSDLAPYAKSLTDSPEIHLGDSLQWETRRNRALFESGELINIPTGDPDHPLRLPRSFLLSDYFLPRLNQVFDYARRPEYPGIESDLTAMLSLNTDTEREAMVEFYRRIREYIEGDRNHVWNWYIANLMQPVRLSQNPVSRLVGNPPWVVYNAMAADRQNAFRQQAQDRNLWAGAHLATQNDLAATFVATCVDFYLQPGGDFGFVMPYATLRARHWAPFRTGQWTAAAGPPTLADLSQDAWDFMNVNSPPFPQANASAIFGTKVNAVGRRRRRAQAAPLAAIQTVSSTESVNPRMPWDEVRPKLTYTRRIARQTARSEAYADAFRNGATLFPQPLVVFETPNSRALGKVYFKTNPGKGVWKGRERNGSVEERFVKPALFSRLLLPFGIIRPSHIIAPFAQDGRSLEYPLPQGVGASEFLRYWSRADLDWRQYSSGRPPHTLLDQIDYQGKLSSQLDTGKPEKLVYNSSGSNLTSAVVTSDLILSHTLYWIACETSEENHYLSAIFNARCLREFFRDACRASDRHFMLLPVQNLPIPQFDPDNQHHANLAAQSMLAHQRVAAIVAERQAAARRTARNYILNDPAMQPILAGIDQSARAILPNYCSGGG